MCALISTLSTLPHAHTLTVIQVVDRIREVGDRPPCQLDALGLASELVRARGLEQRLVSDRVVENDAERPEVERRVGEEEAVWAVSLGGVVVGTDRRF